jgi:hypothetical protein
MSISITVTCDTCNDSEEVEYEFGAVSLPDGWVEDPDDDEQHLCEQCQIDKGLLEPPPPVIYVITPAQPLRAANGWTTECRQCRAGIWIPAADVDASLFEPRTCAVCQHLAGPKQLCAGQNAWVPME